MNKERQAILSLIALGKITPAEAERLLALCESGREQAWAMGLLATALVLEMSPAIVRATHSLVPQFTGLSQAIAALSHLIGGVL